MRKRRKANILNSMRQYRYDGPTVHKPWAFFVRVAAIVALVAGAGGCAGADSASPVATVTFTSSKASLTPGSPVDFTYQFDVAPGAKIDGDYRVFVQVVDSDGHGTSWNDDHAPVVATSQWKPGQTIKYTRTSFAPIIPYVGEVAVEVGLYKGQERLPLRTQPPMEKAPRTRAYRVGTLQLLPATAGDNLFIVRRSGWYPPEYESNAEWAWTQKAAVFGLEVNPRRDVMLYLQLDTNPGAIGGNPQHVTVSLGSQVIDQFLADTPELILRKIPITAAQLGTGDSPEQFRLEVDRTFVPANLSSGTGVKDTRELGLRVLHYFVEAR
jgi:hypothetical protein